MEFRGVLIDPELESLDECHEFPKQWETTLVRNNECDLTVCHDQDRTRKGCKLFGYIFYGTIAVYKAMDDIETDQDYSEFRDFLNQNLFIVPPSAQTRIEC